MEAQVTIKATVEDLDLLRTALTSFRQTENDLYKDTANKDMKRKSLARQNIVLATTMLEKLGVKS